VENYYSTTLSSGMEIIAQPMAGVQSAALAFFVGSGASYESWEVAGLSHLTEGTMFRGTEHRSSREINDQMDLLGASHNSNTGLEVTLFSGMLLGDRLLDALDIFVDVLRYASFPSDELEAVRGLQLQEIGQRNDQPAQLVMDRARQMYFAGHPFANDVLGTPESVESLSREQVTDGWQGRYRPNNMLLAVAGKFEWSRVVERLEKLSAGWKIGEPRPSRSEPAVNPTVTVQHSEVAQENLCFTFPGVRYGYERYYAAALASTVLGGGMNSRLFTEVREKRGLAYSVGARLDAMSTAGLVRVYAGTQPERARESVDVIRSELKRLESYGITEDELDVTKVRLKSRVIMSSESTGNRAMSIGRDWWYERRFRTLAEIRDQIDAVTVEDVSAYLTHARVTDNLGLFTIGPLSAADLGVEDRAFEVAAPA
jgi:predicted Zn-dependent peptidase